MVTGREHRMTEVFARLAPGATLDAARAELRTAYSAMIAAHPETYKPEDRYTIEVTRMHDQINARANTILWVLFAASGLLFVIASSNVANLVLARTVRRESELAVRSALGASRPRCGDRFWQRVLSFAEAGRSRQFCLPYRWSKFWAAMPRAFPCAQQACRSTLAWSGSAWALP